MKSRQVGHEVRTLLSPLAVLVLALSSASLGALSTAPSAASSPAVKTGERSADPEAVRLLERAAAAPTTTAYHGVQFISAWSERGASGIVVEVDHRPGTGTSVHTDGNAQSPAADTFLPADHKEPSLGSGSNSLALLRTNYELTQHGSHRVAGRPTELVEARRPGARTAAGRFWVDTETGLVLRREVYDERGRTTRASAFVEVEVGQAGSRPTRASRLPSAWPDEVAASAFPQMRAEGWHCPNRLAETLSLVDARKAGGAQPILHLSFSDGLSSVSLFEQRGRLDVANLEGYRAVSSRGGTVHMRDGVPMRVVWEADGMVFTVVADAPGHTVTQVLSGLPSPDQDQGQRGRLSRGMDRVASWFNPFG